MITIGKHSNNLTVGEVKAIFAHANESYPGAVGTVDIETDGEYVDLTYNIRERSDIPFQRIRRITGYLVGDLSRFNNAKRREVDDRVKHTGGVSMDRDTPTPPIVERYFYGEYYKCPCCDLIIAKYDREKMRYCCRCGQAIDWRGTYGHEEK